MSADTEHLGRRRYLMRQHLLVDLRQPAADRLDAASTDVPVKSIRSESITSAWSLRKDSRAAGPSLSTDAGAATSFPVNSRSPVSVVAHRPGAQLAARWERPAVLASSRSRGGTASSAS